jgi:hypothetical protein
MLRANFLYSLLVSAHQGFMYAARSIGSVQNFDLTDFCSAYLALYGRSWSLSLFTSFAGQSDTYA